LSHACWRSARPIRSRTKSYTHSAISLKRLNSPKIYKQCFKLHLYNVFLCCRHIIS
jgi:hypothetical protein